MMMEKPINWFPHIRGKPDTSRICDSRSESRSGEPLSGFWKPSVIRYGFGTEERGLQAGGEKAWVCTNLLWIIKSISGIYRRKVCCSGYFFQERGYQISQPISIV
jgi:hypothetical protein